MYTVLSAHKTEQDQIIDVQQHLEPSTKPIAVQKQNWNNVYVKYTGFISKASNTTHIKPQLIVSVIHTETGGEFRVSSAGAIGPMQIKPTTARIEHVNAWNSQQNIMGGTKYLQYLIVKYHGDIKKALEAYNCGPTRVDKGNIPRSSVTYASNIIKFMNNLT